MGFQLYLPQEWTDDRARCRKVGVPEELGFKTKPSVARQHIEAALAAGYPHGVVLADAAHGDETAWREALAGRGCGTPSVYVRERRCGGVSVSRWKRRRPRA